MKKASPSKEVTSPSQANHTTKIPAQRQRLLAALIEYGSITTYEAREQLNVVMPAARIMELKKQGHVIYTKYETLPDGAGRLHPRSARYILVKLAEVAE